MGFYLKKLLRQFKAGLKKKIQAELNNKGFSLISTLVASVIGLIVIFGLNKSLVHLNTQSMQFKSQMRIQSLHKRVADILNNKCNFNELQQKIPFGISPYSIEKSYGLRYSPEGTNEFTGSSGCSSPKSNCNIKMYYQVGNNINHSSFNCMTP